MFMGFNSKILTQHIKTCNLSSNVISSQSNLYHDKEIMYARRRVHQGNSLISALFQLNPFRLN